MTRGPRQLAVLLSALAAACAPGCMMRSGPAPKAWIADDMVALTDRMPPTTNLDVFDFRRGVVRLFAAANETVCFQLVIDAEQDETLDRVRLRFEDLFTPRKDRIGIDSIRAFRMLPVKVAEYPPWYLRLVESAPQPASFYDALVPLNAPGHGQSYRVERGQRLAFWVDVSVPRSALPGEYTGRMTVSAAGRAPWTADLYVKVYNVVLPDSRPLAAVGGFSHETLFATMLQRQGRPYTPARLDRTNPLIREGLTLLRQMMRLGHDHRLDLFDRDLRPALKRDAQGQIRLDWDDYDAIVLPYLSGTAFDDRIGCPAWPMPFAADWPDSAHYGGLRDPQYTHTAMSVLASCYSHMAAIPEAKGRMFYWPYRGQIGQAGYAEGLQLAKLCRAVDPDTPILSRLPAHPPGPTGWQAPPDFAAFTDIFAPPGQWLDPTTAAGLTRPDHPLYGVWLAPGTPPYMPTLGLLATPADVRALPWFAMKYHCAGLLVDEVLNWTAAGGPPGQEPTAPAGAEARLFYPGRPFGLDDVLPSVRLKRLRRGLQDLAYLWLLQLRERDPIAQSMLDAMARYAGLAATADHYLDPRLDGWVEDGLLWENARRILAEECQAAVHPDEVTSADALGLHVAWRAFHERTRSVRVVQARPRVTPLESGAFRVTVRFELFNECAEKAAVQIAAASLPEGWACLGADRVAAELPPAGRGELSLQLEGPHFATDGGGKMVLPFRLTTDARSEQQIRVPVPALRCGSMPRPPRIDGVLDDWPMRAGNTAMAFRLLGRRGGLGDGLARRQTAVFAAYDEQNLYFAIRCGEPKAAGMVVKPSNVVRYEQLLACGEDLVEILLDPGQAAESPADLYHIVLKPNGAVVAHHGVPSDPPLGPVLPWAANVSAAVTVEKDAWVAELSIPRSAFGPAGAEQFWAVDFTRFAAQGDEASSWSEAPRYFYAPEGLGLMYVPAQDSAPSGE